MEILIVYKPEKKMAAECIFYKIAQKLNFRYIRPDKREMILLDGTYIKMIEAKEPNLRGRRCDLIFMDNNITIEEVYNFCYGRYKEVRFF